MRLGQERSGVVTASGKGSDGTPSGTSVAGKVLTSSKHKEVAFMSCDTLKSLDDRCHPGGGKIWNDWLPLAEESLWKGPSCQPSINNTPGSSLEGKGVLVPIECWSSRYTKTSSVQSISPHGKLMTQQSHLLKWANWHSETGPTLSKSHSPYLSPS